MGGRLVRAWTIGAALLVPASGCATDGLWRAQEKEVIQRILLSSVQVVLERGGERIRTGSGVVIEGRPAAAGAECFVLTSGHTVGRPPGDGELYVLLDRHRGVGVRARASVLAHRETEEVDLALLRARTTECVAARPGRAPALGDAIWIVGFPWGGHIRLVGGIVSQVTLDEARDLHAVSRLMVDASVAYGTSGGGVFDARTGRLVGLVEGYGTARVAFGQRPSVQYIDVPVPGETYVTSLATIDRFLTEAGQAHFLGFRR